MVQKMQFETLQEWLTWQESLNPKEIDLGLDRVSIVLEKLNLSAKFFCPVITVAGTNGKGSTVAFIESILMQAGISVGCYTSPHLFDYNERIRLNQQAVSDDKLCEAFELIDQVRGDIPLTYFEFATLASLVLFKKNNVDVVVLEVGLGGRLDAVNVVDADVAVITSIGIDHVDWLGDDIESIGREKAGVMRAHKPAVLGFFNPPQSILDYAQQLEVPLIRLGHEYLYQCLTNESWQLKGLKEPMDELPVPGLHGSFQLQNAAAAIMAIQALQSLEKIPPNVLNKQNLGKGLKRVKLTGRFQILADNPLVIVDVAHNEQSAGALRDLLHDQPVAGKTLAVIGMLSDKAVSEVLQTLSAEVDCWFSAGLSVTRGLPAKNMAQAVREMHADVKLSASDSVAEACATARAEASKSDRIIVFGSFYTVAEATNFFNSKR